MISCMVAGGLNGSGEGQHSGLMVVEHLRDGNGFVQKRPFCHTILLSGVAGDTPAIKKVAMWCGHGAFLGCGYCTLRGQRVANAMRFLGYSKATPWGLCPRTQDAEGRCFAGDNACKLSHENQLERAEDVERERITPGVNPKALKARGLELGCHGLSPVIQALPYLHYSNAFPVPIAHSGPFGVVKRFWELTLNTQTDNLRISTASMKIIRDRAEDIIDTLDFGRSYTDITKQSGTWVMENWAHWTETWSVYVLRPHNGVNILPHEVSKMWDFLRRGLLHFMRMCPQEDVPKTAEEAKRLLKRYGAEAQRHIGPVACSYNLHMLVCRLADQENARGKVAFGTEYWIELCVQQAKTILDGRSTHFPEITLVKDLLVSRALSRMYSSGGIQSYDESVGTAAQPMMASNIDEGDLHGCQLLGSGRSMTAEESDIASSAVCALWSTFSSVLESLGWTEYLLSQADISVYCHADSGGPTSEIIHSQAYERPKVKESFYVRVSYVEELGGGRPAREVDYVAKIKFFVKVVLVQCSVSGSPGTSSVNGGSSPRSGPEQTSATSDTSSSSSQKACSSTPSRSGGKPEVLRLAIATLMEVERGRTASGVLWKYREGQHRLVESYAVMFRHMQGKVVSARSNKQLGTQWFVPYSNLSGH